MYLVRLGIGGNVQRFKQWLSHLDPLAQVTDLPAVALDGQISLQVETIVALETIQKLPDVLRASGQPRQQATPVKWAVLSSQPFAVRQAIKQADPKAVFDAEQNSAVFWVTTVLGLPALNDLEGVIDVVRSVAQ